MRVQHGAEGGCLPPGDVTVPAGCHRLPAHPLQRGRLLLLSALRYTAGSQVGGGGRAVAVDVEAVNFWVRFLLAVAALRHGKGKDFEGPPVLPEGHLIVLAQMLASEAHNLKRFAKGEKLERFPERWEGTFRSSSTSLMAEIISASGRERSGPWIVVPI